jgi:cytoskeletal protein RodZ
MNKPRRQSFRRRLKTQPNDSERRWDSAKALVKSVAPGALLVLGVTIAIGFGAFSLFKPGSTPPKDSGDTQIVAATTPSPLPAEKASHSSPTPDDLDAARSGTIVAEDSTHHELPSSTPVSTASPLPQPTAIVDDNKTGDVKLSEVERKSFERERRKAERRRSRLEAMYRKHEISDEAYKKGQDEYKSEMAKYRSAMDGAGSANE